MVRDGDAMAARVALLERRLDLLLAYVEHIDMTGGFHQGIGEFADVDFDEWRREGWGEWPTMPERMRVA